MGWSKAVPRTISPAHLNCQLKKIMVLLNLVLILLKVIGLDG